jgi:uncharacterized membrane protein YhhN
MFAIVGLVYNVIVLLSANKAPNMLFFIGGYMAFLIALTMYYYEMQEKEKKIAFWKALVVILLIAIIVVLIASIFNQ